MALSTRVCQPTVARRPVAVPIRGRRTAVVVQANTLRELTNQVAQAFVTIFSPAKDTLKDYEGTSNAFAGSRLHSQGKRPFKDGFDAKGVPKKATSAAKVPKPTPAEAEAARSAGYLEGAIGRVMAHQFKGDGNEPKRSGTAVEGWKGSIHTRTRDGFHSQSK